ncbi:uncharacterized protein TNCV_4304151 [Trichonephila clavipes]|uniref:Mutator-like transposase domain-containing protein n=1 Tax=Trichonephila clavipes TaxID=2585209 RepID=A0A8X6UPV6_TRICX|nr:uncharacterized protein TNCV_4304151 [Trichonephila clavipes]
MLGRRIADRQPPPTFLPELRRALLDEWCNILQHQIDNLILSMPRRSSTKVFKKRRGVFNKGRCNKSNDGCGESNSTVPKNSADEKIVLMVQSFVLMKLNHLPKCDSSENYELNTRLVYAMRCIGKGAESARMFCGIMNLPPPPTKFSKYNHILLQATRETCEHSMAEAVREAVDEKMMEKGTLLLLLMVAGRSVVFFEEWLGDSHKC